ncbi:MAG: hypothetical protein IKT40_11955 [Bacilli bacterium]|nr:hypothetical protein [Bacilli bacterium]
MDKLTLKNFIDRAKLIHGDKYDYSKVEYINNNTKVCIICPTHGEFWQSPKSHLKGYGCKECNGIRILTTERFIEESKLIHGNKYDYSKVEYVNYNTKVCIICPIHGEFWQLPHSHLKGHGCKKCKTIKIHEKQKKTTKQFIIESKSIYGDKYDYSKVEYKNCNEKVCIICPIHGEFWVIPTRHLMNVGCPKCNKKSKLNVEKFIKKAKLIYGDKYDYSKVEYKGSSTEVCIVCPIHGEFWQKPKDHLKGYACEKCHIDNDKKIKLENFIKKANEIHNNKYDYSKVEYINDKVCVKITCPIHGEFLQKPKDHLRGYGCKECNIEYNKLKQKNDFIINAKLIHDNKYDYSKVEYVNNYTKVCIICPIHGEFWQTPKSHLNGHGCIRCYNTRGKSRQHDNNWFIEKSREIHGNKYDYSKVKYERLDSKVCIICPIHGEFWQTPANHIYSKNGCKKCSKTCELNTEEFIKNAIKIHGNKYDYSKVEYINNRTKVCIICPIHGEFLQKPNCHLIGSGCPKCKSSKLELEIRLFLEENKIIYEEQKTFDWLKFKNNQFLDFYLPQYGVAIECQGEQHFQISGWGKEDSGRKVLKRDFNKLKLCNDNNIKIYYFSNLGINYPYHVFENKDELLKEIKNNNHVRR